jgi:PKD repeat protein
VRRPSHTYAAPGAYAAVLTVNDGHGGTDTAGVAISVSAPANVPPVAVAVGVPQTGAAPLAVSFSGATSTDANGDSLTFGWVFGDGGSAAGRLASHTYATAGGYAAVLTVDDGHGGTDTASVGISATPPLASFPATAVLDDFNRANGAPGANWQDQTTRFSITSNALAPQTGEAYLEWAPTSFGPNQEVFATLGTVSGSGTEQNLSLKTQGATFSSGHLEVSYSASGARVDVATFTPPSTWKNWGSIAGVTLASGNQFGARAFSDGTVQVYKNGAVVGTVSVAGWTFAGNGGRIGVSTYNSSGTRFDNFGGGTVPAALALSGPAAPAGQRAVEFPALPGEVSLSGAYPNPTTGGIELSLALPHESEVSMSVLDIQGREVWSTPLQRRAAGRWTLDWDGHTARGGASAGVYLARVRVGPQVLLRRFAIIR